MENIFDTTVEFSRLLVSSWWNGGEAWKSCHPNSQHLSSTEQLNQTVNRSNQGMAVRQRRIRRATTGHQPASIWASKGKEEKKKGSGAQMFEHGPVRNLDQGSIGTHLNKEQETWNRLVRFSCSKLFCKLDPVTVESSSQSNTFPFGFHLIHPPNSLVLQAVCLLPLWESGKTHSYHRNL